MNQTVRVLNMLSEKLKTLKGQGVVCVCVCGEFERLIISGVCSVIGM